MTAAPPPDPALRRATVAVYAVFVASGFAFASWASRIPQVRDALELSPRSLGLVLLATAVGSVVVDAAGRRRRRPARDGADDHRHDLLVGVGLAITAVGMRVGVLPVIPGLFLLGLGLGTWDVAMNVEGGAVERDLGRAIMSRFHAGFSVGTVIGALIGSVMVASASPPPRTCWPSRGSSRSRARSR